MSDYVRLDVKYKGKVAGPYSGDLGKRTNATTILYDIGSKRRKSLEKATNSKRRNCKSAVPGCVLAIKALDKTGYFLHPNRAITDMETMFEPKDTDNQAFFDALDDAHKQKTDTKSAFKQNHYQKTLLSGDNFKKFKNIKNTLKTNGMELLISNPKVSKNKILYENEREVLFKKD